MFDNEEIEFMGSGVTEFYGIYSHLHIWFIPKYSIGWYEYYGRLKFRATNFYII